MKQKSLPEIFRQERLRRKLTQAQLAKISGVTQARISNFEAGQDILLSTVLNIANALEIFVTALPKAKQAQSPERKRQLTHLLEKYHGED